MYVRMLVKSAPLPLLLCRLSRVCMNQVLRHLCIMCTTTAGTKGACVCVWVGVGVRVCMWVCGCVCVRGCVGVRACGCVCVGGCGWVWVCLCGWV